MLGYNSEKLEWFLSTCNRVLDGNECLSPTDVVEFKLFIEGATAVRLEKVTCQSTYHFFRVGLLRRIVTGSIPYAINQYVTMKPTKLTTEECRNHDIQMSKMVTSNNSVIKRGIVPGVGSSGDMGKMLLTYFDLSYPETAKELMGYVRSLIALTTGSNITIHQDPDEGRIR